MRDYDGNIRLKVKLDTKGIKEQSDELKSKAEDALKPVASETPTKKAAQNFSKMTRGISRALKRIKDMMLGAFVFSVISKGIQNALGYLKEMVIKNDALNNSLGQVKGNLETTFITAVQAIMPAIEKLADILATVTSYISAFVAGMFGKTAKEAQTAAKEISDAAKKAKGGMAGFDEINAISSSDAGIEAVFGADTEGLKEFNAFIRENKELIEGVIIVLGILVAAVAAYNVATAIAAITTNAVAWPILAVVAAIAAIVAAVILVIKYWDEICDAAKATWDFIAAVFTAAVNWIYDKIIEPIGEFFKGVWDGIVSGAKLAWWGIKVGIISMVNFVIKVINAMVAGILAPLNLVIAGLNKIPGINIKPLALSIPTIDLPPLPALAQGAVVPRSKPFAAILGDNTQETEVVSPLSTMKQALFEVLAEYGGLDNGEKTIILNIDGREFGRAVTKYGGAEGLRHGAKLAIKNA